MEAVVVGGGLIGATAALGLAQQGYEVTLLDPMSPQVSRGEFGVDIRNVALNPQSQRLLADLGAWQEELAVSYQGMRVWEEAGTGEMTFDAQSLGRQELGWLVEMSPLTCVLHEACKAKINLQQAAVEHIVVEADGVTLTTTSNQTMHPAFVVAADGAQSRLRTSLGIAARSFPVDQHALATVVETERSHDGVAYQRFLAEGPLALLPTVSTMDDWRERNLVSIVWSQPEAEAKRRVALPPEEFCAELTRASEGVLGEIKRVDQRFSFPLQQQLAKQFAYQESVVLLGDAARVVHPLAGLGVNLGFEDVLAMLKITEGGDGLSDKRRLANFSRQRQTRSRHMVKLLGLLQRTYAEGNPWFLMARNFATRRLNQMPLVKQQIMREAMGLGPISEV